MVLVPEQFVSCIQRTEIPRNSRPYKKWLERPAEELIEEGKTARMILDMQDEAIPPENVLGKATILSEAKVEAGNLQTVAGRIANAVGKMAQDQQSAPTSNGGAMPPLPNAHGWEDGVDALQSWPFGNTPKALITSHIGKMDDLNDVLELNRLDLLQEYRALNWNMGSLSLEDTHTIMKVLSGELTLTPGENPPALENIIKHLSRFRDDMEADTRSSYQWAINRNMHEFYAEDIEEMLSRMDAINARGAYINRMWKPKEEDAAGRQGSSRASSTRERVYTTYQDAIDAGEEPLYNDPWFNLVTERYSRERRHGLLALVNQLREQGNIKLRSELTPAERKQWRVPDLGSPFTVARRDGTMREYAVKNWMADDLEKAEGVRWSWGIPDFVPKYGGKDAYAGFTKLNNGLKAYKFVLAPGQAIDLAMRKFGGGHFHTRYRVDKWAKSAAKDGGELLNLYFKGSETRRRAVLDITQNTDEVIPGPPRDYPQELRADRRSVGGGQECNATAEPGSP